MSPADFEDVNCRVWGGGVNVERNRGKLLGAASDTQLLAREKMGASVP